MPSHLLNMLSLGREETFLALHHLVGRNREIYALGHGLAPAHLGQLGTGCLRRHRKGTPQRINSD